MSVFVKYFSCVSIIKKDWKKSASPHHRSSTLFFSTPQGLQFNFQLDLLKIKKGMGINKAIENNVDKLTWSKK